MVDQTQQISRCACLIGGKKNVSKFITSEKNVCKNVLPRETDYQLISIPDPVIISFRINWDALTKFISVKSIDDFDFLPKIPFLTNTLATVCILTGPSN